MWSGETGFDRSRIVMSQIRRGIGEGELKGQVLRL